MEIIFVGYFRQVTAQKKEFILVKSGEHVGQYVFSVETLTKNSLNMCMVSVAERHVAPCLLKPAVTKSQSIAQDLWTLQFQPLNNGTFRTH